MNRTGAIRPELPEIKSENRSRQQSRLERVRQAIEDAAHLLPSQGPITVFIHHNTLHAFEHLPFEEAVVAGARTFGCQPYLAESRYRQELSRGRIRHDDLEATLLEDLGDTAGTTFEFLGTRLQLRRAMLEHPLLTGPAAELRWVIEETEALRKFRRESPCSVRDRMVNDTRHWVMRDLRNMQPGRAGASDLETQLVQAVFDRFDSPYMERWSDDTWEAVCLHLLWWICRDRVARAVSLHQRPTLYKRRTRRTADSSSRLRHRELLMKATGEDADRLVHEVLIRFCAAFIDQGFAHWSLPEREAGLFAAFATQAGQSCGPPDRWLQPLRGELQRLVAAGTTPLESIAESLDALGVVVDDQAQYLEEVLLALPGFAGMIWQMETCGDRVAQSAPRGSLVEFLAVRLILDRLALAHLAQGTLGFRGPLTELGPELARRQPEPPTARVEQRAFLFFQMAQLQGWSPERLLRLPAAEWWRLIEELESFSDDERRRVFHLAYERRFRNQALDALATHVAARSRNRIAAPSEEQPGDSGPVPAFQVVCCIDEREESFRRHLEEVAPHCETFGAAGFFAVAMYYRGAADAHATPLCPIVIKPRHYVTERVADEHQHSERRRQRRRRTIGTVTHRVHIGSRTFAGGWLAAVLGSLASLPLVMRVLFPRAAAQLRRFLGGFVRPPAVTELRLERTAPEPGPADGQVGYLVEEMSAAVERLLRDISLTRRMSRLVVIVGHGSSSMNNPHESAHDCGACGGGRGGPNARAYAQMANDDRVRAQLAERNLVIPSETRFLGAYHNTCDDSLTYFDLDRLPATHQPDLQHVSAALDEARQRNAHERCRRFESAPLDLSPEAGLRHVEGRSEDLSQVRPEYGHATNALCFVGRRAWSRGLFLDRRSFLHSYDPAHDDDQHSILARILQAVIPVCAGINLEYYFSVVDPSGYGCGTKLPHNITSLLGVMNGAASDLLPGLPWQMVEIHEPVRLLLVIETTPDGFLQIMSRNAEIDRLVRGRWVQVATFDPAACTIQLFRNGQFEPYQTEAAELPVVRSSADWYRGWRDHLPLARILGVHDR